MDCRSPAPAEIRANQTILIAGIEYRVLEHPAAPEWPYGQAGDQGTVYHLCAGAEHRALKVFHPRFRTPALVTGAERIARCAGLPGLRAADRVVLTPRRHVALLTEHPDLTYAALMPWVNGTSWQESVQGRQELAPVQSLVLARACALTLSCMEEQGMAHCDLSGANLLLPWLTAPAGLNGAVRDRPVELVDLEDMYLKGADPPAPLPSGTPGYTHRTTREGCWGPEADRFAGAVLLAEMLGWCDGQVRAAAYGETYFDPAELQQPYERFHLLMGVLAARWGAPVARLFQQAWQSEILSDCPTFGEWLVTLPFGVEKPAGPVKAGAAHEPEPAAAAMVAVAAMPASGPTARTWRRWAPAAGGAVLAGAALILLLAMRSAGPEPEPSPAATGAETPPETVGSATGSPVTDPADTSPPVSHPAEAEPPAPPDPDPGGEPPAATQPAQPPSSQPPASRSRYQGYISGPGTVESGLRVSYQVVITDSAGRPVKTSRILWITLGDTWAGHIMDGGTLVTKHPGQVRFRAIVQDLGITVERTVTVVDPLG